MGGLVKTEVRKLAKKFGLVTADKKDSQGLCFLGKIDMKDFLKNYIKPKAGQVLNERGEVVGNHNGAVFFTLGERHHFTVRTIKSQNNAERTRNDAERGEHENQKPYYVVAKDVKKNTITVSHDPKASIDGDSRKVFEIKGVNWIGRAPRSGARLLARIRYRQPLQKARFMIYDSRFKIHFDEAQSGGAPGQSIVLYDGEQCLGGGITS